jgi:hypothetical protein
MTKHYVYVDSRNRNSNESINDLTVHLHQPIKNVARCGLVSFSKGNNSWNVHDGNNKIRWREIYFSNGSYNQLQNYFEISLPTGYFGINELLTQITTKMSDTNGRLTGAETATTYTYSIDDDYRISIMGTASSTSLSNRYWAFYEPDDHKKFNSSILHAILNLQREDVVSYTNVDQNAAPTDAMWRQSQSSLSSAGRTLKSRFSYTENQSVIHIASNELAENSQRMVVKDGQTDTMKTNVLETIQILVNRWSYIHLNKNANDIQYHDIHNRTISHFDVKILGEHFETLHESAESNFKAVFVFETLDEPRTEVNQMYKEYNADSYRQAHRVINY